MSDRGFWDDDRGSAPVEFVMVAALLTALTLANVGLTRLLASHEPLPQRPAA